MEKRRKIHKITAVIVSIILAVSVLPMGFDVKSVRASSGTLYIGNTLVTELNAADVLGNGMVSYDAASNTLTLRDAELEECRVEGEPESGTYAYGIKYIGSSSILKLVLYGRNTITADTVDAKECYGIYAGDTDTLQISGTGTLSVTSGAASEKSVGIKAGNLTMESGTVTACAGESAKYESAGIYTEEDLRVKGGSLEGNGAAAIGSSYGIYAERFMNVSGGSVVGKGGSCENEGEVISVGIRVGSTTEITGGTITATGGSATATGDGSYIGRSYGFYTAAAGLYLRGGTTTCTGGEATTKSTGMHVQSFFHIKDGILAATGGTATESYGASCNSELYLTGGENITFIGDTQAYKIVNSVTNTYGMTGCTLFAKAGEDSGTASNVTITDKVIQNNKYVNIVAKMDITKVESTYGGTYTIEPNLTTAVAKGTVIKINAVPWSKFRLETIIVKGSEYNQTVTVTNNTFKMPGYPVTITVRFEKIPCSRHNPGAWFQGENEHQRSCTLCFAIMDKEAHIDSNKDGKCDVCNYDKNAQNSSSNAGGGSSSNAGGTGIAIPQKKPYVKLNVSSITLQKGKSTSVVKITKKYPANDKVKSYKSSNKKVATVSSKGKVTAKKPGKTTITVTMKSGAKAKYTVKVQKKKVVTKSIKLNKKSYTLKRGKTFTLKVTRNPITATEKITYKSSNKKVATVTSKGKIKAKKKGKATITVRTTNGKKATCKITVK